MRGTNIKHLHTFDNVKFEVPDESNLLEFYAGLTGEVSTTVSAMGSTSILMVTNIEKA
jgi:hypothetical protein